MPPQSTITLTVQSAATGSVVKIALSGRLDVHTAASIWNDCLSLQKKHHPQQWIIDAQHLNYCDSAGMVLFQTLNAEQKKEQHTFQIQNLDSQLQHWLDLTIPLTQTENNQSTQSTSKTRLNILCSSLGRQTLYWLRDLYINIAFLGALCSQMLQSIRHPTRLRWHTLWKAIEDTGPSALPIIALIGFLIGLISTFQSAPAFGEFGAQIYIVNLVGLGLVREMGPLMTAVLLAGRTASSFAAEIGTMKINQEIDALTTMGINPIYFLMLPRIIATTLITPILNAFLILFALIGCFLVMHTLGYSFDAFGTQLKSAIDLSSCFGGMLKVLAFGFVISSIGCLHGFKTQNGAQAVGYSTTHAVVSSLIMIVIVDGLFATLYYTLGI